MKEIKTEDAIGSVLCHDITEIVKDQRKGPRFKKGHIIKEEDIEVLLNLGKEHLYVFDVQPRPCRVQGSGVAARSAAHHEHIINMIVVHI